MQKLKLALRTVWSNPFVTIVAIVSLGLGLGANAAIFTLFNQALLQPLPVREPNRLVNLASPGPKQGSTSCGMAGDCDSVFSYPMFRDLEKTQTVFTGIAAHVRFSANFAYSGQSSTGDGVFVSGGYFPLLGLQPFLGRLINPADDRAIGESPVVVLSYDFWRTRFAEDRGVLDKTLIVNGRPMTIAGVAPQGFNGTTLGIGPQVFVPITMRAAMEPLSKIDDRQSYWAYLFARLKPGVTIEQARTAINSPYRAIINDVEAPLQHFSPQTLDRFRKKEITLENGSIGQSNLHKEVETPLTLLLVVTFLVLVIACANVANLLLTRAVARTGEMAVRLSLGANRWQLISQLLTESCMLALLGGLFGIFVGEGTLRLMSTLLPPQAASTLDFQMNGRAILFIGVLTIGTGILFGLFPALHAAKPDTFSALKGQAGQPGGGRAVKRFRAILATAQITMSMALLVAAGLFIKSLLKLSEVDLGMNVENVIEFGISPERNSYTPERSRALFERLEDELGALPGVTSVGASTVQLLSGSNWGGNVTVEGFQTGLDTDTHSYRNEIGPGYFRTLGIPLIAGRDFTRADNLKSPRVVIVNEEFARKFNLGRNAVGKRMKQGSGNGELDMEIVGLVPDAKYSEVKNKQLPLFYLAYRQDTHLGSTNFYVRTSADAEQLLGAIRPLVARLDPALPISDLHTLQFQVWDNLTGDRVVSVLSAAFAVLATILAAVGLYGVLAYSVAQRTREIGLRMALGAEPGRVRGMVLRQVSWMTLLGAVIGLAAGAGLGRLAESLLFDVKGYDPTVLALAAAALVIVALGAGYIPAYRASRIDPLKALRYE